MFITYLSVTGTAQGMRWS